MLFYTTCPSPIGMLLVLSDGQALTGLRLETQRPPAMPMERRDGLALFDQVQSWLEGYFQGRKPAINFPLSPAGTAFQQQVWEILQRIPYGQTITYGTIAGEISPTMSAQAVGGAVGRNPISIIIPCHRCIGAKGRLTGYAGGLEIKQWLLRHEEETK